MFSVFVLLLLLINKVYFHVLHGENVMAKDGITRFFNSSRRERSDCDRSNTTLSLGFETGDIIKEGRITQGEIDKLQEWLWMSGYECLSDQQVLQFLLSCDRDLEFAKVTIREYFQTRQGSSDIFSERNLDRDELQNMMSIADFNIMPKRTKDGCVIVLFKLKTSDYSRYNTAASIKMVQMVIDSALHEYPASGLIMIFDVEKMSFMHMTKIRLGVVMRYLKYLQEGMPVKLKNIHALNVIYVVEKLVSWIKPLMKDSLRNLIITHQKSTNMTSFYEKYVERECLPVDYGGMLPSVEELNVKTIEKVRKMTTFFEEEERQREKIMQNLSQS